MQLKSFKSIRGALAAATCAALAAPAQGGQESLSFSPPIKDPWDIDSALLYYSEQGRVSVVEPVMIATQQQADGDILALTLALDTLTGASPSGAAPTNTAMTITSPSGESTTSVAAGELPMHTFRDQRTALGIGYTQPLSRLLRHTLGANLSTETDYSSIGLSETLELDLNNRLTTLSAGIGLRMDYVAATGGIPVALSTTADDQRAAETSGLMQGEKKQVTDLMVGVTQVLSRRLLTQINYSFSHQDGYLEDPYKVVSVVDSSGHRLHDIYESRPATRTSQSLFWKLAAHLPEDVVQLSYRYFWDDWAIRSHTVEMNYRIALTAGSYLQPRLRYYQQSAADLFHHSLQAVTGVTQVSADLRLAQMQSQTLGLKLGLPVPTLWGLFKDGEFALLLEQMEQRGDSHPAEAIGVQQGLDLYPTLKATMVQLQYSFSF